MPIYEYECNACGETHEFIQKLSEGPKRKCPSCGKSRLRKLVSAAAFHLKGNGWYVTDFRDNDKKKKSDGGAEKAAEGSNGHGANGSGESKPDKIAEPKTDKKASGKKDAGAAASA